MKVTYVALALLLITILTFNLWSRVQWVRATIAAVLLLVQAWILGLSFRHACS